MQLRVVSLNVWALPWGLAPDPTARMNFIADRLPALDADIVGFQEVWTPAAREVLVEGGRRAGFEAIWHRPMSFGGSGLLVLSKLPILQSRFTPFTVRGRPERLDHSDYHGGKGFIILELETPTGPILFLNTHLHARYAESLQTDEYLAVRAAQATQIASALSDLDPPLIAVGDFNLREGEPEYRILVGLSGLEDNAAALNQRKATILASNPYRQGDDSGRSEERIDYIFTRSGLQRDVQVEQTKRVFDEPLPLNDRTITYSDHAGVCSDVLVQGPGRLRPAPSPQVLAESRALLNQGLAGDEERGRDQRLGAMAGFAGAIASGGASMAVTRRNWLRFSLGLGALASAAVGGGFAWMGLRTTPAETDGYRTILADLERLGAKIPRKLGLDDGIGAFSLTQTDPGVQPPQKPAPSDSHKPPKGPRVGPRTPGIA